MHLFLTLLRTSGPPHLFKCQLQPKVKSSNVTLPRELLLFPSFCVTKFNYYHQAPTPALRVSMSTCGCGYASDHGATVGNRAMTGSWRGCRLDSNPESPGSDPICVCEHIVPVLRLCVWKRPTQRGVCCPCELGHKARRAPGRRTPFKHPLNRSVFRVVVRTLGRTDDIMLKY